VHLATPYADLLIPNTQPNVEGSDVNSHNLNVLQRLEHNGQDPNVQFRIVRTVVQELAAYRNLTNKLREDAVMSYFCKSCKACRVKYCNKMTEEAHPECCRRIGRKSFANATKVNEIVAIKIIADAINDLRWQVEDSERTACGLWQWDYTAYSGACHDLEMIRGAL